MSKLHTAPFTNPDFKVSVITNAPDLESAIGISQERADKLSIQVMQLLDNPLDPTTAELMLASAKVVTTVEELMWIMFKIGTYAELTTGAGKKILDNYDRINPSNNPN